VIPDMVLGLVGSVAGGGIVWLVISSKAEMATMFLIGCGAAALMNAVDDLRGQGSMTWIETERG